MNQIRIKNHFRQYNHFFEGLQLFLPLWATQSFSSLGSSMTSYALVILLTICTYAPYVLFSIFAGALSDRWNKKVIMLVCDSFAACTTLAVMFLLKNDSLELWHLYFINGLNGLMNTIQQPAADVTVSLLTPKEKYQRAGGLKSFSNSLVTMLSPVFATAMLSFAGINAVILFDLLTFATAFVTLAFFIPVPHRKRPENETAGGSVLSQAREGLQYLKKNRGILDLILFLAAINLTASMYNAALPAMILSRNGGSQTALALVSTATGLANITGSILVSISPAPKSRVRIICNSLLFSMSTENFLLAFGRQTPVWCLGAVLGWLFIPVMGTNLDVLFRLHIPLEMQGRVYSARNTLQFFTIPVGYLLGGLLVDQVMEPFMADISRNLSAGIPADGGNLMGQLLVGLFGSGKGAGAAMLFFFLGILGIVTCIIFRRDHNIWELEM